MKGGDVRLSAEDLEEVSKVIQVHNVKGGRYIDEIGDAKLLLWG